MDNIAQRTHKGGIIKSTLIALAFIFAFLIFLVIISEPSDTNTATTAPSNANVAPQVTQEKKETKSVSFPYEIVARKDLTIPSAKRYELRILIAETDASEVNIKKLTEKLVEDHKASYDALSILYYFDKYQVEGAYTLAKADWAPEGNWGKADLGKNQSITYNFLDRSSVDPANAPTEEERIINKAMRDLFYEMNENTSELITDEQVAEVLAPEYGKTVKEMVQIRTDVTSYDIGK